VTKRIILAATMTLALLTLVASALVAPAGARYAAAGGRPALGTSDSAGSVKRRCRIVIRKVHHHKRRVRVCHRVKPKLPPAAKVVARAAIGANSLDAIDSLAVGDGSVWAVLGDGQKIVRIDAATLQVTATITNPLPVEWPPTIAFGEGSIWLTDPIPGVGSDSPTGALVRIDPATNTVVATIPVGRSPEGIAFTDGAVWTANHRSDQAQVAAPPHTFSVSRVDVASNTATAQVVVETRADTGDSWGNFCCGPQGATAGAGAVWVADATTNDVSRIDPATNSVTAHITNPGHQACGSMAADDTSVWLTEGCDAEGLWRIDPASNSVTATLRLPGIGIDVRSAFGSLWVSTGASTGWLNSKNSLTRIDPQANRVVGRTAVQSPGPLAVGDGVLWMGSGASLLELLPA
jgi:YVTN family beta-propeller protein